MALFTVLVEHERRWGPEHVKAVKAGGAFLDVNGERNEFLVDEGCELRISVGFGFQPSAGASGRGRAEVDQQRFVLGFRLAQRSVNIFVP
jgi:hypothetical protein